MGLFVKDIKSMDDLFVHVLQDLYYIEGRVLKVLPVMMDKANNPDLVEIIRDLLGETKRQIARIEQVFALLKKQPYATKCPAINGIVEEADEIAAQVKDKHVLDAALIAAAQSVEHYEITRYGSLIAWAEELRKGTIAKLLRESLDEKKAAEKRVSSLADRTIYVQAAN